MQLKRKLAIASTKSQQFFGINVRPALHSPFFEQACFNANAPLGGVCLAERLGCSYFRAASS